MQAFPPSAARPSLQQLTPNSVEPEKIDPVENKAEANVARTGCFWADVKNAADENKLGAILMTGELEQKMNPVSNPKGVVHIQAKDDGTNYSLSIYNGNEPEKKTDVQKAYWLPWSAAEPYIYNDKAVLGSEFVTLSELDASGCKFFLTSNLSGCRFSVTDQFVAHYSRGQCDTEASENALTENADGRNNAEFRLMDKFPSNSVTKRRTLSQSEKSRAIGPTRQKYLFDQESYSYQRNKTQGSGSAFVIGIKDETEGWSFKYLKHDVAENQSQGTWHTFD